MSKQSTKLSRSLSLVLRHDPGAINLTLDSEGWASVDELLACMVRHGRNLDRARLREIVAGSDKRRFRFSDDGTRIRANQGHSINIDLKFKEEAPPDLLYHGTTTRLMGMIAREGLRKMKRQHVHLSPDIRTAHTVGQRQGKPVILEVAASSMAAHGFRFYLSENGVWLTEAVPPDYLNRQFSI